MLVLCNACKKPIRTKDELITSFYFLKIKPYHSSCYSKNLKSFRTILLNNYPINSIATMFHIILSSIMGLIFLSFAITAVIEGDEDLFLWITASVFIVSFLIILPIFVRLYSYYKFEKILK